MGRHNGRNRPQVPWPQWGMLVCSLFFPSSFFLTQVLQKRVNAVCFNSEDTLLVTGGDDKCVKVWDCKSRSVDAIQSMCDAKDSVSCISVDIPCIFSASIDGTVRCYDVRMGRLTSDTLGRALSRGFFFMLPRSRFISFPPLIRLRAAHSACDFVVSVT